jgi:predicted PilT family ATPase
MVNKSIDVYINDDYLFSAVVGKKAKIKISKGSDIGKRLLQALMAGDKITVLSTNPS